MKKTLMYVGTICVVFLSVFMLVNADTSGGIYLAKGDSVTTAGTKHTNKNVVIDFRNNGTTTTSSFKDTLQTKGLIFYSDTSSQINTLKKDTLQIVNIFTNAGNGKTVRFKMSYYSGGTSQALYESYSTN